MPIEAALTAAGALVGGIALAIERGLAVRRLANGHDPSTRTAVAVERLATLIERHEARTEDRHDELMKAAVEASKDLDHIKTVLHRP